MLNIVKKIFLKFRGSRDGKSLFEKFFKDNFPEAATVFLKKNDFGEVRVLKIQNQAREDLILFIDDKRQCGTDLPIAGVADVLKLFKHSNLIVARVGNACGFALAKIANHPAVSRVDAIEINPVMLEAMKFFESRTGPLLKNPKIKFIVADAGEYFSTAGEKYDLIDIWVRSAEVPYSRPLYEEEFIGAVKSRLSKDGIFSFWMARASSPDFAEKMRRRLLKFFKYVSWHQPREKYLLAADRPLFL